jgi:glycerol-3-phosphate dehydrogenase
MNRADEVDEHVVHDSNAEKVKLAIAELGDNILMTREQRISEISALPCWDMVIIGGGITGAGILKLACQMGLKVLLLEQKDFAWGSSSRSSKMVHGGLRYMAQGQLALTRESVSERQRLLAQGEPLISKQSFVMSHYKKVFPGPWTFNTLLSCYDFIAGAKQHKFWPKSSYLALAPKVAETNLLGGTQFFDALTEDARLVQRLLQESLHLGGQALNYAKVTQLEMGVERNQITVELEDGEQARTLNANVVVNACGAWSKLLKTDVLKSKALKTNVSDTDERSSELRKNTAQQAKNTRFNMRPLRGSHLVIANWRLPVASVISVQHPEDKRPVQIYPWQNVTIVGTTDVEHHEDMSFEAKISQAEFDYLLATVKQQFPAANITQDDIISTFAGVRPVTTSGASLDPSKEKRQHHIEQHQGVITVTGGKLTTFRLIAEQVLNKACQHLAINNNRQKVMLTKALKAAGQQPILSQFPSTLPSSVPSYVQQQIQACYGEFSQVFVNASEEADFSPIRYSRHLWAELIWSVRFEQVQHLDDLLLRRTRLGNVLPEGARELLPRIKTICSPHLSWNEAKWQAEITRYLSLWQQSYSLPAYEITAEQGSL